MRIEDDNGISALLRSEETRLCTGFGFTEGPVWVPFDNALLFSDIPGNRMHRWRPGWTEAEVYREPSGWSNGLTLDHAGNVLACEHGGRRVSRGPYADPHDHMAIADNYQGVRLNSPNDLVVHSSGSIFFTDPTYGRDSGRVPRFGAEGQQPDLDFRGVYRIDPDGSLHLAVSEGFEQPNGLAFSPDESVLYIGDSQARLIWRYEVGPDCWLGARTLFVDQHEDSRRGAPDGMKVDTDGRLWTTGAGGVSVHTADGKYLGVFEMDEHAANLTFGGPDFSTLFMTAGTSVYSIETAVRGIAPGSRGGPRSGSRGPSRPTASTALTRGAARGKTPRGKACCWLTSGSWSSSGSRGKTPCGKACWLEYTKAAVRPMVPARARRQGPGDGHEEHRAFPSPIKVGWRAAAPCGGA